MKITVEGVSYRITFEHDRHHACTLCAIEKLREGEDKRWVQEILGAGVAACSPHDHFNRAIGRKISLARAIQAAFMRDRRKVFWEAYWKEREQVTQQQWCA